MKRTVVAVVSVHKYRYAQIRTLRHPAVFTARRLSVQQISALVLRFFQSFVNPAHAGATFFPGWTDGSIQDNESETRRGSCCVVGFQFINPREAFEAGPI